jgi:hypothetical protein
MHEFLFLALQSDPLPDRRPESNRKTVTLPIVSEKRQLDHWIFSFVFIRQMVFEMRYQEFRINEMQMVLLYFGQPNLKLLRNLWKVIE